MDQKKLEEGLSQLPLYEYFYFPTSELTFADRVRWICEHECPMYGQSWACPPGTGTVSQCKKHCLSYEKGLCISTIVEVDDISDIEATLATRPDHEAITNEVADLMRSLGVEPFILSTEACAECERCAILDGLPCRHPERMHPCVESQGIVMTELAEKHGIEFQYGSNIVTWFSLLLYNDQAAPGGNA